MREESHSIIDHDVVEWVDVPEGEQFLPLKLWSRWKYDKDGHPEEKQKSRVVVQAFHQAKAGADKASLVASSEAARLFMALTTKPDWSFEVVDIKTAGISTS